MSQILCVKIAQKRITRYTRVGATEYHNDRYGVFPYDRVYLINAGDLPTMKRMFKYCFTLNLDEELLSALGQMHASDRYTVTVQSLGRAKDTLALHHADRQLFRNLAKDYRLDTVVVPTKTRKVKHDVIIKDVPNPVVQLDGVWDTIIDYTFTSAIKHFHTNRYVLMPRITLHTPHREVPVACTVCSHVFDFHANKCTPGTLDCAQKICLKNGQKGKDA